MPQRSPFDLSGTVAVVTAGCSGIGAAIADALVQSGARVVATSRDAARAADHEAETSGRVVGRCLRFEAEEVDEFVRATADEFGGIHILVNAAASRSPGRSVEESGPDDLMHEFRDSCISAFLLSQAVVAAHSRTKTRSIINIGSIYGSLAVDHRIYDSPERQSPIGYACAKGALVQMTRYLAAYWAPLGVRVNVVGAGGVRRSQTESFLKRYNERVPLGRMAEADEIASAAAFLASEASSYITGADLPVDGGLHVW